MRREGKVCSMGRESKGKDCKGGEGMRREGKVKAKIVKGGIEAERR